MRKVWLLASALLAFLNFVKSQEVARTLYSARYDNLDIDTILGSNRLVSNYVDCLLSRKPCPPEGKDLKRILPEALRTKCARCSPIQKENALKIITRLYFDYPDQYRALRERWDPSGEYHRRFEEYLRGLQFNQIGGNGGNGAGAATAPPSGGNGITVESGGNDRPVRNDLDRQPASQSSNVQAVVIDPTLSGGSLNTLLATPPPPAPATERPRPPAPAPPLVVVNRFGEDAATVRPPPPVQTVITTTTTQRPTTTVRQTRPVTRQTTTRNTQRTTTRFITRVPQTPPPTPPRTTTTTSTSTTLPPRPPPPPPLPPLPPVQQQQPLLPQAPPLPPQAYPTILYERPQAAPPRATASPPPPPRPYYVPDSPAAPPTSYATTPDSIIDHFFVPPSQAANPPLPPSPIVGLWNQLGTKIADTADAIAGMLQKTVDVLVTSHIQSHQRALRRT
uniref:Chemosensory protein 5 n=1 Tax=Anopheles atroparvus TaxID=41427 RepID=A0A8W7NQW2_ANOAO